MSRQKRQGTAWEQRFIHDAQTVGLKAWPLARRGPSDPGDIAIETPSGDVIVVEARNRQTMGVHDALIEAQEQTLKADLPFAPLLTVVAWKRYTPAQPGHRRKQVGHPVIIMDEADFLAIVASM